MTLTVVLAGIICFGEWTGVMRAVLGGPYYAGALDVATITVLGAAAWQGIRSRQFQVKAADVLLTVFVAVALVEVLNPNVPSLTVGLEGFRKSAFAIIAYAIVRLSGDKNGAMKFYRIMALGSIPAFLFAASQIAFHPAVVDEIITSSGVSSTSFHLGVVLRAFAPTAGPFHLGILAGSVAVIAVVLSVVLGRRWLVVGMFASAILVATLTRANIIAAGIVGAFLAILAGSSAARRQILVAGIACVVAGLVGLVSITGVPGVNPGQPAPTGGGASPGATSSPAPTANLTGILNPLGDKNLQHRVDYWRTDLLAILQQPVIGYGTSSAADGFGAEYAAAKSNNFDPHSMYLKPALEDGLGGFIVFIGALLAIALAALQSLKRDRRVGLILVGIGLLTAISGLSGPMLDAYPFSLLFWATAGWALRTSDPLENPNATPV
jgi:O-Antigen ligase